MRGAAAAACALLLGACASRTTPSPEPAPAVEVAPAATAVAVLPAVAPPAIRVGLASDLAEFVLPAPGAPWIVTTNGRTELRRGPLRFRAQGAPAVVRIQAGAFSEEPSARTAAADLEKRTGLPTSVVFSAD